MKATDLTDPTEITQYFALSWAKTRVPKPHVVDEIIFIHLHFSFGLVTV